MAVRERDLEMHPEVLHRIASAYFDERRADAAASRLGRTVGRKRRSTSSGRPHRLVRLAAAVADVVAAAATWVGL